MGSCSFPYKVFGEKLECYTGFLDVFNQFVAPHRAAPQYGGVAVTAFPMLAWSITGSYSRFLYFSRNSWKT